MSTMPGNPYVKEIEERDLHPESALVYATLAAAFEQRTANLIACSQKVYIRDSPDEIRVRLGEAPLVPGVGTPTPGAKQ